MTTRVTLAQLADMSGADLGSTAWRTIDQDRFDRFAAAAGDEQWIHTDPVRAKDGPFGTTIAHGYLTLALVIPMFAELLETDAGTKLNYGLNRVRFPAPVPVGSRIRLSATLDEVTEIPGGCRSSSTRLWRSKGRLNPAVSLSQCSASTLRRAHDDHRPRDHGG